jgi:hypothetical protein
MIEIKQLSSHVDLKSGENRYSMVVGPVGHEAGLEVELNAMTYVQLGEAAQHILGEASQGPSRDFTSEAASQLATEHLQREMAPSHQSDHEASLEAKLREMERQELQNNASPANTQLSRDPSEAPLTPEDLLRQVGWFKDSDPVSPPADVLSDSPFEEEIEDPGELESYPEDDGVEAV